MIEPAFRRTLENICCPCVRKPTAGQELVDKNNFEYSPIRIGEFILFYGRRRSFFPFHCLLGPDWLLNILVFGLIILIDGVVLWVIRALGWPVILIGGFGAAVLLISYTMVAFSDPGIVYKEDDDIEEQIALSQSSDSLAVGQSGNRSITPEVFKPMPRVPSASRIDCGHCKIKRPMTSTHCGYCGTCIHGLDHHCPWSGKCIGEENLMPFRVFVCTLSFQCYFLIGALIYWLVSLSSNLPTGPSI